MIPVQIVFDIDGVLVLIDKNISASTYSYSLETISFFSRHNSILTVDCHDGLPKDTYYLIPSVLELMKLLFSRSDVRVAFFSGGEDARNTQLVKQLLIRALGPEHYECIAPDLIILSRKDVINCKDIALETLKKQFDNYGLHSVTSYKKDLTKVSDTLLNTLFVEDNPSVIYDGQEKNLLCCHSARPIHYELLGKSETKRYSECFRLFCSRCVGIQCEVAADELFCKVNSIYYITGLIMECIEKNKEETMLTHLFQLQFQETARPGRFTPRFIAALKTQRYYDQGLLHLQTINPTLSFNTPSYYLQPVNSKTNQKSTIVAEEMNRPLLTMQFIK